MQLTLDAAPVLAGSLSLYFHERLATCARDYDPAPQEDTCWYLSRLLERFGASRELFAYQDGRVDLRPLALLYGDAIGAPDDRSRCLLLQQLGDMALFLGALFPAHFSHRGIGHDYVVGMGGSAYDYLADNARHGRHIFAELAGAFERMLSLVADVCSGDRHEADTDILALYQRWLDTRDPLARRRLIGLGIDLSGSELMQ